MSRDADYFFRQRYAGLDLIAKLPKPLGRDIATAFESYRAHGEFPASTPEDFSQELLFFADSGARAQFVAGDIAFPYESRVGGETFWRSQRSQAPYIERIVEQYPHLDIELAQQLWLERGRGMPHAFPAPSDQKARWRSVDETTPDFASSLAAAGPYAAAFVTPRFGTGGSEKVIRAMAASIERLTGLPGLIVVADTRVPAEDLPTGAICLPNLTLWGEPFLRAPNEVRARVLRDVLVKAGAPRVISVNSSLGNFLLEDGALREAGVETASALFLLGVGAGGAATGFVQIADWLIDAGVTLFTDNAHIARLLAQRNAYAEAVVLAMPATAATNAPPSGSRVLWAGRIDAQKRPDLLLDIAQLSPQLIYEVWGTPLISQNSAREAIAGRPNIVYRGGFETFEAIDLSQIGCLLYTSAYDGTPNILLEAMGRGLPCVCSAVGGIPDLMAEGRGVLVDASAPAGAYVAALGGLMGDPAARQRMAGAGRDYIRRHHTLEGFERDVARLLATMRAASGG
ncbi:MAG: glycosyltransferase family 4 protein [Caulobacteraceae bacterium]